MVLENLNNRIDIKQLSVNETRQFNTLDFDPEKDLGEGGFEVAKSYFNYYKKRVLERDYAEDATDNRHGNDVFTWQRDWTLVLDVASEVKLLFPDRFHELATDTAFLDSFRNHSFADALILDRAELLKLAVGYMSINPEGLAGFPLDAKTLKQVSLYPTEYGDFNYDMKLRQWRYAKIIDSDYTPSMSQYDSGIPYQDVREKVELFQKGLTQTPVRRKNFIDALGSMRILFPEKYEEFKPTVEQWQSFHDEIAALRENDHYSEVSGWWGYSWADAATAMAILAAEGVRITAQGLELIHLPKAEGQQESLPEVRNF